MRLFLNLEKEIFYFTTDFDKSMMDFVDAKWGSVHNKNTTWYEYSESLVVSLKYKPYTTSSITASSNVCGRYFFQSN